MMRFGLIANLKRTGAREAVGGFVAWTKQHHHELVLCDDLTLIAPTGSKLVARSVVGANCDMLVSMGGDGTMLAAARAAVPHDTPILGINLGSLGFLTQQRHQQMVGALEAVAAGKYHIEERMLLHVEVSGVEISLPCALNDAVVSNAPVSRVIDINLKVNGEDVVTYTSDGLILATPTGSTAYSLAAGGPIMHPKMDAIIAAPISPFSLTIRPIVFDASDVLQLQVTNEKRQATLTLDGQVVVALHHNEVITVTRAKSRAKFVVLPDNSFYSVLRSKLHWGVPPQMV